MPELIDIIQACKKGEKSAQCFVYEQFSPKMRALCFRYLKSKEDVEDVLHDSFLYIFTKIGQYKGTGSFEGWMRRIIVGTAVDFIKSKLKIDFTRNDIDHIQTQLHDHVSIKDINDYSQQNESLDSIDFSEKEVLDILQKLPEGYRMVFNLYVFEKYSHKEIADALEISTGTSKSQLSKARKLLQKQLYDLAQKKRQANENKEYKEILRVVI
jgi:RNA polymerase sigma-70 factor (ECF subfamily)